MKKIEFINQPRQLYYFLKESNIEHKSVRVLILLRTPVNIYYDKDTECIKKNLINDCFINKNDTKIVEDIMKSNTIAIQHLNNERNQSIADLAQLKVSYEKEILPWNIKWKIVN